MAFCRALDNLPLAVELGATTCWSRRSNCSIEQRDDTLAWALELLGAVLAGSKPERAAELLREAEELRQQLGLTLAGLELEQHEQAVATLEAS